MSRPKLYKTEAVILKQTPLGEADRILTLYTPEMGKLRAVARGVRRPRSKLGGHVELLSHASLSLTRGQNLDVVSQGETIHSFRGLREDLRRLSRGLYLADLINSFTPEESSNYLLYQLLLNTLGWLEEASKLDLIIRYFEMRLLGFAGYQPELYWCVGCRTQLTPGDYLFSCSLGGVLCAACRSHGEEALILASINVLKVLRFLQREEYSEVAQLRVSSSLGMEVERLLRSYIRHLLEREVKSVSFMNLVTSGTVTPQH